MREDQRTADTNVSPARGPASSESRPSVEKCLLLRFKSVSLLVRRMPRPASGTSLINHIFRELQSPFVFPGRIRLRTPRARRRPLSLFATAGNQWPVRSAFVRRLFSMTSVNPVSVYRSDRACCIKRIAVRPLVSCRREKRKRASPSTGGPQRMRPGKTKGDCNSPKNVVIRLVPLAGRGHPADKEGTDFERSKRHFSTLGRDSELAGHALG